MLLLSALVFATLTVTLGLPPLLALLIALAVNAGVAMLSYDVLLRPLSGRPAFSQIIVTVGFSIVLGLR